MTINTIKYPSKKKSSVNIQKFKLVKKTPLTIEKTDANDHLSLYPKITKNEIEYPSKKKNLPILSRNSNSRIKQQ